ncbi:hypothetical protein [Algoriphagus taiwanensis]|uniref:Uncharacterized protein n=1 Tax=Algoriphagus taiwanensis TaxID=1445656 RepID=A0ABQ6Q6N8_9BACT|nr:hypothetical protein Ataiwa_40220 [Algoriphagus taiwanensis]
MTEFEVREKILDLFNKERQIPNGEFNESHFLDFLTNPPHHKDTIKNSFRGVRRYYRFMDAIELEFAICFTLSDLDKYYSVDSLTKKVLERLTKGRGNLMILKQRREEKENYWIEILLTTILLLTYFWLGFHWLPILLTVIFGVTIWWILSSKIHNKEHNKKLNLIIGRKN